MTVDNSCSSDEATDAFDELLQSNPLAKWMANTGLPLVLSKESGHRFVMRTQLPQTSWRTLGCQPSKTREEARQSMFARADRALKSKPKPLRRASRG